VCLTRWIGRGQLASLCRHSLKRILELHFANRLSGVLMLALFLEHHATSQTYEYKMETVVVTKLLKRRIC
jgi:hypothetical protein